MNVNGFVDLAQQVHEIFRHSLLGHIVIHAPQFAPDGSLFMMDYGSTWGPNPDSRLLHIKYIRGKLIGQGSYGSVYLALHTVTAELMAVKQVELPSTAGTSEIWWPSIRCGNALKWMNDGGRVRARNALPLPSETT